jgi:hypothetical protein
MQPGDGRKFAGNSVLRNRNRNRNRTVIGYSWIVKVKFDDVQHSKINHRTAEMGHFRPGQRALRPTSASPQKLTLGSNEDSRDGQADIQ